jgi:hypothetical protein
LIKQAAELRVPVLLDQVHELVPRHELRDGVRERECPDAQRVEMHALALQHVDGLVHRGLVDP